MSPWMKFDQAPEASALRVPERLEAAQERAAIMQYDGGYDRDHAERYAAQQWAIPVEWLR